MRDKKIAIGPIQYFWPAQKVKDFYIQIGETAADIVYLGETVCPKRRELSFRDYWNIAHELREAGKQVVFSTLTLLETPADVRELKRICDNGEFIIEANDFGAVELLNDKNLPFVGGSALNCFNAIALKKLLSLGMQRYILPAEMHKDWFAALLSNGELIELRSKFETEILVWGHVPLAWSARCFTARSKGISKDNCQRVCLEYPEGRKVSSQEGEEVFIINGIQTLSGVRQNLITDLTTLGDLDVLRLNPAEQGTFEMLKNVHGHRLGLTPCVEGPVECNGYWHGLAGKETVHPLL